MIMLILYKFCFAFTYFYFVTYCYVKYYSITYKGIGTSHWCIVQKQPSHLNDVKRIQWLKDYFIPFSSYQTISMRKMELRFCRKTTLASLRPGTVKPLTTLLCATICAIQKAISATMNSSQSPLANLSVRWYKFWRWIQRQNECVYFTITCCVFYSICLNTVSWTGHTSY